MDISEYDFGSPRPQTPIQSFFKSQSKTQVSSKKVIFSNLLHIFLVLLGRDLHRHHKRKVSWNNKIARKLREQSLRNTKDRKKTSHYNTRNNTKIENRNAWQQNNELIVITQWVYSNLPCLMALLFHSHMTNNDFCCCFLTCQAGLMKTGSASYILRWRIYDLLPIYLSVDIL